MICRRRHNHFIGRLCAALIVAAGLISVAAPAAWAQSFQRGPANPAFEAWRDGRIPQAKSGDHVLGYIPVPWKQMLVTEKEPGAKGLNGAPTLYDLRTYGNVTAVRNQAGCGSCWTFSTFGSAESWLLKNPTETWDFSENNLKDYHGFDPGPCEGGNDWMSCAYLARGGGPILEAHDPYNDYDDRPSPGGPKMKQMTSMLRFPTSAEIKDAVMTYGALSVALYWDDGYYNGADSTFYCPDSVGMSEYGVLISNHAVTLVGWDDDKVVTGGPQPDPAPGAWLIKNSWGTGWGTAGYFYLSYYDTNAVVPVGGGYLFGPMAEATDYGRIYQYDELGLCWTAGTGTTDTCWGANVFTAEASEDLTAVAFYTAGPNTTYTVYVYDTFSGTAFSNLLGSKSGSFAEDGYHTVTLDTLIPLTMGDEFGIAVRLTTPGNTWPIACEGYWAGYSSTAVVNPGESFFSSDGTYWEDGYVGDPDYNSNVCLKGLTEGVPEGTVAPPSFSPAPGTYTSPVSIYCSTSGATIHYTTNGDEPSEGSATYSTPLTLTVTTTIKAKAYKTAMTASATVSGAYTILDFGPLCEALDNCDLDWTSAGDGLWAPQTLVTHDGVDAAQSPDINDYQLSYIQTEVTGPVQVSFWWKASSEFYYDWLGFFMDDGYVNEISGNTGWEQVTFNVPSGAHILKWAYSKDSSFSEGQDCGWVDEVMIGEVSGDLICEAVDNCDLTWTNAGDGLWVSQALVTHDGVDAAQSPDITDNQLSYIEAEVTGPGQVSFWWKASCETTYDWLGFFMDYEYVDDISGDTGWEQVTFEVPAGTHMLSWAYRKDSSLSYYQDCGWVDQVAFGGGATGSINVVDSILPADDLLMPFDTLAQGLAHTEQVTIQNTDLENPLTVSSLGIEGEQVGYYENFDSGNAVGWVPCHAPHWSVVSGEYVAQTVDTEFMRSLYTGLSWTDCSVEATVRRTGDTGNSAAVVVRGTDNFDPYTMAGSGYIVVIDGTGYYGVVRIAGGSPYFVNGGWTYSAYINLGTTPNVVLFSIEGSSIYLYVNGNLVWNGVDTAVSAAGRIGLGGYSTPGLETVHYFDEVTVGAPVTPVKAAISPVQQWYNEHPVAGGSLTRSPQVAPPDCPVADKGPVEPPVKAGRGAFELANLPSLPAVVPGGGSVTFDVKFVPNEPGTFETNLVISSNDIDTPTVTIALSGEATPPGEMPVAGTAALAILAGAIAAAAAIKNRRRR